MKIQPVKNYRKKEKKYSIREREIILKRTLGAYK